MKYVVAVSGGVDSVVLLDMLVKSGEHELIVAHFDHGIRSDSADDARFVGALAKKYNLPFISKREELGEKASEELARDRRYAFLRRVAKDYKATIVTAHHADDVVETIVINILRGTGWRGLAVLNAKGVERPLLHMTKEEIYHYALTKRLEWVEDSTNATSVYLRNRVRFHVHKTISLEVRQKLLKLWQRQIFLKKMIETEVNTLLTTNSEYSRYFFIMTSSDVAAELLRTVIWRRTRKNLLAAQLQRGVLAIKTARAGTYIQLGEGVELHFNVTSFIALDHQKML